MACRLVLLLAAALLAAACDGFPRDPEHTLERVRGGTLVAGAVHDPPFVVVEPGQVPSGPGVRVVEAFARALGAQVHWQVRTHDRMLADLEAYRLDLVVGGSDADTPWTRRIALTAPFRVDAAGQAPRMRVLALPPGENGWRMAVERYLRGDEARALLRDADDRGSRR